MTAPPPRFRFRLHREYGLLLLCGGTLFAMAVLVEHFLTGENLLLVLRNKAPLGILAIGMTLVILTGGIDLSVGSIVALSSVAMGRVWEGTQSAPAALVAALAVGALCGSANGAIVAAGGVPPLIVTLATLSVFRGLAFAFWSETSVWRFPPEIRAWSEANILWLPAPLWLAAALFATAAVYLAFTRGGRAVYAVGHNAAAAALAGVPVRALRFRLYLLNGLLAGLVAILYAARNNSVKPDVGAGDELAAITIVVLGGISVAGGEGSIPGALLAFLTLVFLQNGLDLGRRVFHLPKEADELVVAVVLIGALLLDAGFRRRAARALGVVTGPEPGGAGASGTG
jgi:ribose/xylose/arabinose/galactoside ABC-type transport system permease subunit